MDSSRFFNLNLVSGISIGNGGTYFCLNSIESGEYVSSIYFKRNTSVDRVTFGRNDRDPQFYQGSLYYISTREGIDRIMRLGGISEPVIVCSFRKIISYAPYGDAVLVVASENFKSARPFVITRLKYKHDSTGLLRKRRSLYMVSGGVRKIVGGNYDVAEVKTDGRRIIFSSTHTNDDYSLTDLYEVTPDDEEIRKLTRGRGVIDSFSVSPDGKIAYLGHRSGLKEWATRKVYFVQEGKSFEVGMTAGIFTSTDMYDDAAPRIQWDHGAVYVIGQEGGTTILFRISDEKVDRITTADVSVRQFDVKDRMISYSFSTSDHPSVLVTDGTEYDPNPGLESRRVSEIQAGSIEGWAMVTDKTGPSILFIHGGPHGTYGPLFNCEMQYFASLGYNIIFSNPRGSMGYGDDFAGGSVGDWGGGDYEDILGFLQGAREKFQLTGPVGLKGVSYGGYMVNLIVTRDHSFGAAISEKGVSNLLSSCGTSDIGYWFDAPEEIGRSDPWSEESISLFMERSPITHVRNVSTPTLLIHGEVDHRCPIEQSEQFFTALKFYGVDTMFIRLPGEGHELDNREDPTNRLEIMEIKAQWFDKYLKSRKGSTDMRKGSSVQEH